MTIELTLGWWLAPLLATLVAWIWAVSNFEGSRGGYMSGLGDLFYAAGAMIATLAAWLVWAVLT